MDRWYHTPPNYTGIVGCYTIKIDTSLVGVFFDYLNRFGMAYTWRQDNPTDVPIAQVVKTIQDAIDYSLTRGCYMIGDIRMIARAIDPEYELLCDGSTYNRVDYPELYDIIAPIYHIDPDTFVVPDLIDRFPMGSAIPGLSGGSDSIDIEVENLPAHDHVTEIGSGAGLALAPGELPVALPLIGGFTGSTGDGDPIDITPPYHTLIPVIVAR